MTDLLRHCGAKNLWLLTAVLFSSPALRAQQPAFTTDDFIDRMGIHAARPDAALLELGIRHYRTVLKNDATSEDQPAVLGQFYNRYGIRPTLLLDWAKTGPPAEMVRLVEQYHPGVIAAIEGPEDVNNPYGQAPLLKYKGKTGVAGACDYLTDYYAALKAEPATRGIPVACFTMLDFVGNGERDAYGLNSFDYENWQTFQGAKIPEWRLEASMVKADSIVGVGHVTKPLIASACGYNVAGRADRRAVDIRSQTRYIPMLYAEYFRHGLVRSYVFKLYNEEQYGWIGPEGVKRPVFYAVKTLIRLLKDATWNPWIHDWDNKDFSPRALNFTLVGAPETVHTILLQKHTGQYTLLIWNEVSNYDKPHDKDIINAPVPVTLKLMAPVNLPVAMYSLNENGTYALNVSKFASGVLDLKVPDSVMVLQFTPAAPKDTTPPTPPGVLSATTTNKSVTLSWTPSKDSVGVAGYFIFRNGEYIGSTPTATFTDAGNRLRPGLGYTYAVRAFDAAGNMSVRATATALLKAEG